MTNNTKEIIIKVYFIIKYIEKKREFFLNLKRANHKLYLLKLICNVASIMYFKVNIVLIAEQLQKFLNV